MAGIFSHTLQVVAETSLHLRVQELHSQPPTARIRNNPSYLLHSFNGEAPIPCQLLYFPQLTEPHVTLDGSLKSRNFRTLDNSICDIIAFRGDGTLPQFQDTASRLLMGLPHLFEKFPGTSLEQLDYLGFINWASGEIQNGEYAKEAQRILKLYLATQAQHRQSQ